MCLHSASGIAYNLHAYIYGPQQLPRSIFSALLQIAHWPTIDVATMFGEGESDQGGRIVWGYQGAPWSPKGPHWLFICGPSSLYGAMIGDCALIGGLRHFERARLGAGGLLCMPRKFATATLHRRVRGPRGAPLRTAGALAPVAPSWLRP